MLEAQANEDIIDTLNELMSLDYSAIAAYQSAIEQLENTRCKKQLQNHCNDHMAHVEVLRNKVHELGSTPRDLVDVKSKLNQSLELMADIVGDDRTILQTIMRNKDLTNTAYGDALANYQDVAGVAFMLEDHLRDERMHRQWIEARLE